MTIKRQTALLVLLLGLLAPLQGAAEIQFSQYHRLSTMFRGAEMSLDIFNGGPQNDMPHLAPRGEYSGQFWRIEPVGAAAPGYMRLSTMFRGADQCLDVFNGGPNNNMTHLTDCANLTGQFWRISAEQDGFHRLTTRFRGAEMCLDVFNGGPKDNQPHLTPCADVSGQYWRIEPTGTPVSP